ncbi:MAG: DUF420 domain-containing protein [Halodesulfurarchaeum sp.]
MAGYGVATTWPREHPRVITVVLTIAGYLVVAGSFLGIIPFPELERNTVVLFSDVIAIVNTLALLAILAGYRFIKRGDRRRHVLSMSTAFTLILVFLVLYTWKQAGGFTKSLVVQQGQFLASYATPITYGYLAMLAVHVLLSILAVPVVLHAVVLGVTQPLDRLGETIHPTVGRIAAISWSLSLFLGIVTYWMLNHVYGWEVLETAAMAAFLGPPAFRR